MKIIDWVRCLFRRGFFQKPSPAPGGLAMAAIVMLTDSQGATLTCDEVYALLDQYAERAARGEDVGHLMPLVQAHLEMCPNCRELYAALSRMIAAG